MYQVHLTMSEISKLTTSVVIGTDCIGSCKSNCNNHAHDGLYMTSKNNLDYDKWGYIIYFLLPGSGLLMKCFNISLMYLIKNPCYPIQWSMSWEITLSDNKMSSCKTSGLELSIVVWRERWVFVLLILVELLTITV